MPVTHILLLTLDAEGRRKVADDVLADLIGKDLVSSGGSLVSLHVTVGAFDAVAIVELDADLMPAFALYLARDIGATATTLRAFDGDQVRDAIRRWDDEHNQTGKLGP